MEYVPFVLSIGAWKDQERILERLRLVLVRVLVRVYVHEIERAEYRDQCAVSTEAEMKDCIEESFKQHTREAILILFRTKDFTITMVLWSTSGYTAAKQMRIVYGVLRNHHVV